jgi:hypothetical protein
LRLCTFARIHISKVIMHAKLQSRQGVYSLLLPTESRAPRVFNFALARRGGSLRANKTKIPFKISSEGVFCGPTWNRTKHLLPRSIGGVSCSVLSFVDQKL